MPKIERLFILIGLLIDLTPPDIIQTTTFSITMTTAQLTVSRVNLPYDVINVIFDFLSHMTENGESGYYLEVTPQGKIRLMLRPSFTGIHDIHVFKRNAVAQYVQLTIQQWTPNGEPAPYCIVDALKQPHRIHTQDAIEQNYKNGFISDSNCYTYSDPETGSRRFAYVELRNYYNQGTTTFHQGCVYDEKNNSYLIAEGGTKLDGTMKIIVNPLNMIWDLDDDDHWADNLDAAETLLALGNMEDNEFDDFVPLQMYM